MLERMTVAEKAGLMFHPPISFRFAAPGDPRRAETLAAVEEMILGRHITHFNVRGRIGGPITPRVAAGFLNDVQAIAARARLAVPVTISTDPRNGFSDHLGVSLSAGDLSRWPEPIALAAVRDPGLVRRFADIVRQEYRAIGIQLALHPQADLATEPRWMRTSGTFGQDAALVAELTRASVLGLQGETLGPDGVACMAKHFPGGGPQKDGEDPHFAYGAEQTYEGGFFEEHLRPFRAAIEAGVAAMMPYYGKPVGTDLEEVGFAFNRPVVTGILRERLGFDGVVCSDWGVLTDGRFEGQVMPAMAWGVEHLDVGARMLKALDAGVDQFGGESCTEVLVRLVEDGVVPESRLDASARRLLSLKQRLGLFEDAVVDAGAADEVVGRPDFVDAGLTAQRRSVTLLRQDGPALPLSRGIRCRVVGFDPGVVAGYGTVVDDDPDVTLMRVAAPYEPRRNGFERFHRAGRLNFTGDELAALLDQMSGPTVLALELDRPAVVGDLLDRAGTVLSFCGAQDSALLDVIFGVARPEGRLPFDLPRSMAAVEAHQPDRPGGTADPVLPYGWGLDLPPA